MIPMKILKISPSSPLMIMIGLGLIGCTNLSTTGIATTIGTTATALIITQNPIVASGVAVTGLGVDYVVNEPNQAQEAISQLEALPEDERTAYLKSMAFWKGFKDLGYLGIIGFLGLLLVQWLIAYFVPRKRLRNLENGLKTTSESMKSKTQQNKEKVPK